MESELSHMLLPYYVYLLKDPWSDEIFYVGKGSGDRANSHEREAEKEDTRETEKLRKIRAIKDRGHKPTVLVIGRYETEPEAFAVEATLIKWVYGFDELTNSVQGHRHKSIRKKGIDEVIAGIDIPFLVKGLCDGSYTNSQRELIINNRIIEKLSWLKERLEEYQFFASDPDIRIPQDPCIWVDGFCNGITAQIKLQLSGRSVVINLRPKSGEMTAREFENFVSQRGFEPKNNGKYAPVADFKTSDGFPGGFELEQVDLMAKTLKEACKRIGQ